MTTGTPGGAPPPSTPAPASTPPPSSAPPSSGGAAEIPAAPHAVLTTDIPLTVEFPFALDAAQQFPHTFTLTSDDGSVTLTMSLANDAVAGDSADTSVIVFTGLAEHHTYTLQCNNGSTTYNLFESVAYEDLQSLGLDGQVSGGGAPSSGNQAAAPPSQ
jgi:hypothetical protein